MQRRQLIIGIIVVIVIFGALYALKTVLLGDAPVATPKQNNLNAQVSESIDTNPSIALPAEAKSFKISDIKYFEGQTWAVVYIEPIERSSADPAYLVMHKVNGTFQKVIGPGTVFPSDAFVDKKVPKSVLEYLGSLGLISATSL